AKNFQWGLRRSTLNHLMCMSYTDVAQVANSSHRSHGQNNDRQGSDRRGGNDNHRGSNNNNNYSESNNRLNFKSIQLSSIHEHDPNTTL
nr:hypothetical protein [Tanacetum cinerariifolium]